MKNFYIQVGLRRTFFATLAEAQGFAQQYFERTGVILGIFSAHQVRRGSN